jgi:hypothetical protein
MEKDQIHEETSKFEDAIYRIAEKLKAFGYLLENQSEASGGVTELIGLGTAISDYSTELIELVNQQVNAIKNNVS